MFTSRPTGTSGLTVKLACLALLMAVILSLFSQPAQAAPSGQRLRDLAGSFLIGYASRNDFWNMSDSAIYQETARTEFNFLTPENAMKWETIEPSQNNFAFGPADQHVAFGQTNNMVLHGHTLVWHSQLPGWVSGGSWTSATLTAAMNNHIDNVMNHWDDGEIAVWDVVNEAFEDNGTRRSSVFQNVIGNSYIELAFQRARAADSQTRLLYNDYNIETINSKSTAVYNMVVDFRNRGVPIDGIGLQMHLTNGGLNYQSLADNMARFAALGLEIYITEMDVRYPTPVSQTDLNNQATIYSNVLARCRAQPACKGLQVWGIPDKYSWVPDVFPGQGAPLLFDDNYNAKPAYFAVQTGLGGTSATNTPTRTPTRTNTPMAGTNLLTNGNIESGTTGWSVFGSGTLASNSSVVHGGTQSLLITGRTAAWNGPSQSMTSKLTSGRTYTTNVWVRSQSGTPNAKVTLQVTANGSTSYLTLAPSTAVNSSSWTLLSGTVNVSWTGTLTSANLYVETDAGTDSFYIDDASFSDGTTSPTNTPTRTPTSTPTRTNTPGPTLTPTRTSTLTPTRTATPGSNLLTNGGIESGTTGWSVLGAGSLSANTSVVHGGTQSLLITGRTAAWNGPSQLVTSLLTNGRTYTTNVWVRTQSGTASAKVTLQVTANGNTSYLTLAPAASVNSTGWTLLSGTTAVSWTGTLSSARFYVETTSGTASFYIDDASFQ